jgi:hypothetical protein
MMFSTFDTWGTKTALSLQELLPAGRQAVTALLLGLPKRQASRQTDRKQGDAGSGPARPPGARSSRLRIFTSGSYAGF